MNCQEYIRFDKNILNGKARIGGTRISVEFILGLLANGWATSQILENYQNVTEQDVLACLAYAAEHRQV